MTENQQRNVVALAGGVGGAKLALGLAKTLSPDRLTIIGNVADDFVHYGLHISPDLDTVMYTLAGIANPLTGWGLDGDTWRMFDMLARYGEDVWFRLGDKDLATHVLRSYWLSQNVPLTTITARLSKQLGVGPRLLPVTDEAVATMVDTREHGVLGFQEYFVRHRWQPTVTRVWFEGVETAHMTDQVAAALASADLIVMCPSNPVLSIAPILAVPGVRELICQRRGICVAVSPFIGGNAVKGPAAKLLPELGLDISAAGVAHYYAGLLNGLVVDEADRAQTARGVDVPVLVTRTLMQSEDDKRRLAEEVIAWGWSL